MDFKNIRTVCIKSSYCVQLKSFCLQINSPCQTKAATKKMNPLRRPGVILTTETKNVNRH